jgi:hypothetical protein
LHLRTCTDEKKHASYKEQRRKAAEKKRKREAKEDMQDSIEGLARWQFLGAKREQLYLLDNTQLKSQLAERGVEIKEGGEDDRLEMIRKLASTGTGSNNDTLMISNGGDDDDNSTAAKRRQFQMMNLPNLHRMSLDDLHAVLAAHGVLDLVPNNASRADIIQLIEDESVEGKKLEQVLMIKSSAVDEDGDVKKELAKEKKPEVVVLDGSGSCSSDDHHRISMMCTHIATIISSAKDVSSMSFNLIKQALLTAYNCDAEDIMNHKAHLKNYAKEQILIEMKKRR